MKSFTNLEAWRVSVLLMQETYRITHAFPRSEQFGLTSQLRRASTSVLANIAEGFGRFTYPDKAHKYTIARGECNEIEAFLLASNELGFCCPEETRKAMALVHHTEKLLSGLISACRRRE